MGTFIATPDDEVREYTRTRRRMDNRNTMVATVRRTHISIRPELISGTPETKKVLLEYMAKDGKVSHILNMSLIRYG